MIKIGKQKVYQSIRKYVKANFEKLDKENFVLGEAFYNRRCHINSVQKVKEGKAEKVYSCFAIDENDNYQCAHFINQLSDGKYQDNTWGWVHEHYDYYIIKEINKDEQQNIWKELTNLKEMLLMANSNWFERFIYHIKVDDL